jgi:hypothetical protein
MPPNVLVPRKPDGAERLAKEPGDGEEKAEADREMVGAGAGRAKLVDADGLPVNEPGMVVRGVADAAGREPLHGLDVPEGVTRVGAGGRLIDGAFATGLPPPMPALGTGRVPTLAGMAAREFAPMPAVVRAEVPPGTARGTLGSRAWTLANDPRVPAERRRLASGCHCFAEAVIGVALGGLPVPCGGGLSLARCG